MKTKEGIWSAVDEYIADMMIPIDAVLESVNEEASAAGLPAISVSAPQGKMLHLLALVTHSKRILEMGTLAGYSAIWMARALPEDGMLVTLEFDAHHAEVARANFARANLSNRVQVRVGAALDTLPLLYEEKLHPFDLIFIDADKNNYPQYFEWSIKLSRPGTLIVVDNVVRNGEILNANSEDERVQGVREMNTLLAKHPRVSATTIQTVGNKGYDGFMLAVVQ